MDLNDNDPVLIIGAGLIGASIGCALTTAKKTVYLADANRTHCLVAASRGAGLIDDVDPETVKTVIVAVPPQAIASVVIDALQRYPNAAVTDTGSVKSVIAERVHRASIPTSRYLGSHPMAGSHHAGPLTAASELFVDRTWVITPESDTPYWVIKRIRSLIELTGARIVELDAPTHDRAVAEISHVPQLLSSLTAARLHEIPHTDVTLAGQGLRDMTRIAQSDVELWRQIIKDNTANIRPQLEAFQHDLAALIDELDHDERVVDVLTRGNIGVAALPQRAGKRPDDTVAVRFAIPDEPGALATLFNKITASGINIEDLSIEHDSEHEIGYLSLNVAVETADLLRAAMKELGWATPAHDHTGGQS